MIFMILAVTKVTAQDTFVVFEKATHVYAVDKHGTNTYRWSVFALADLNSEITDTDVVEFISGKDTHQAEIKWKQAGEYILVIEEFGTCQNLKANRVSVVTTSTIAFKELISDDCADDNNEFAAEMVAMFDSGTVLSESQYPLTVNYQVTIDGTTTNHIANIAYRDQLLNIEGITEDVGNDQTYKIEIIEAKTKFGGQINLVSGKDIHTRILHKKPVIKTIQLN